MRSEEPLLINDPNEFLKEMEMNQNFKNLDENHIDLPNYKILKNLKVHPKTSNENPKSDNEQFITVNDLKEDFSESNPKDLQSPLNSPSKRRIFKLNSEEMCFPRLSHGFSFVKERQKILKMIPEKINENRGEVLNEEKNDNETNNNYLNIDFDYNDPELRILKLLNPKHLKLEPNHNKEYQDYNSNDILVSKPIKSHDRDHIKKKILPKVQYFMNYSKNFYKEKIKRNDRSPTKEHNLTRLLLAGQTIKKQNKMKIPLFLSLDTEILKKQLNTKTSLNSPRLSPVDNEKDGENYFYRIQKLIKKQNALHRNASRHRTSRKTKRETNNIFSFNNFKENDINEIKKICFGESEFNLPCISDNSDHSSEDDLEIQKAIDTAMENSRNIHHTRKNSSLPFVLNLKLDHILNLTEQANGGELNEKKRKKIYSKAKMKQEFNAQENFEKIISEDEKNKVPVQIYWSGEDVLGFNKEFYRYATESLETIKLMKNFIKLLNYNIKNFDIWEAGVLGKWNTLRKRIRYVVNSDYFMKIMLILVLINTLLLSIDGIFELTQDDSDNLSLVNTIFTIAFAIEVCLKLISLGILGYFSDKFNIFDCFIVTASLIELVVLEDSKSSFSAFRALSFFRTIRILRISRLIRGLKYANVLAEKIVDSIQNCLKITLILLIFIYIYCLLGMAIFKGKWEYGEIPQSFETFSNAFIIVLQLITISNWNSVLYSCFRTSISKVFSLLYLSSGVLIGNYILLNLLLAILLDVFAQESTSEYKDLIDDNEMGEDLEELKEKKILELIQTEMENSGLNKEKEEKEKENFKKYVRRFTATFIDKDYKTKNTDKIDMTSSSNLLLENDIGETCKSFFIFSDDSDFRVFCSNLLKAKTTQFLCHFLIFLSMIQLIIYTYIYDETNNESSLPVVSLVLEILIISFFIGELFLQTVTHGFFNYWKKNAWNRLNTLILITSIIILLIENLNSSSPSLSYLRPFKIVVIIRGFSYIEIYRSMISSLLQSIKAIINLVIVILLVWLIFSIIGVTFLKGKMGYCEIENPYNINKNYCEEVLKSEWKIHHQNFDNVLNGLLVLFCMSFFEGFPSFIYLFMDSGPEESGPSRNNTEFILVYFLIFIIVSSIFLMNLFICVIFMNYIMAEKRKKNRFITEEQYRWIAIQKLLVKETPDFSYIKLPDAKIQLFLYRLIKSKYFENFIFLCIALNTIVMGLYYEGCPSNYEKILNQVNFAISLIFIAEAIFKLGAVGMGGYFYSGWNKLDFFVVITSIFEIILEYIGEDKLFVNLAIRRTLRILKVARLLRLIKSYSGLQKLFLTSVYSLPYLINAFVFLFLVYFMFTVLAVFLFRNIK